MNFTSFHLITPSPWPIWNSLSGLFVTMGAVIYFHLSSPILLFIGALGLTIGLIFWWKNVVIEASYQGYHTKNVQTGLKIGILLFIVSEVCFFVSFFWAFFHSALSPVIELGGVWPPLGVETLNPFSIPLLNTAILLSSGATLTASHHYIVTSNRSKALLFLILTVVLGVIFTGLQAFEYGVAAFSISDSVYGSTFFVATGFHGIHVIIGTLFLLVSLIRLNAHQFTSGHHIGFEGASWYWHFVDVVWLLLYICIYWWSY